MAVTMKANRIHVFGGPEVILFEDVPRPTPGTGEVLIRVHAAGVGPRARSRRPARAIAPFQSVTRCSGLPIPALPARTHNTPWPPLKCWHISPALATSSSLPRCL